MLNFYSTPVRNVQDIAFSITCGNQVFKIQKNKKIFHFQTFWSHFEDKS